MLENFFHLYERMVQGVYGVFSAILILRVCVILFALIGFAVLCLLWAGRRSSGSARSAGRASSASTAYAGDSKASYNACEQAWRANEQAVRDHMQAVQQHQQMVDQFHQINQQAHNQFTQQQFDQFSWQSVTPINQGGFVGGPGML